MALVTTYRFTETQHETVPLLYRRPPEHSANTNCPKPRPITSAACCAWPKAMRCNCSTARAMSFAPRWWKSARSASWCRSMKASPGRSSRRLQIHLGQGLSRGERMDWAIQKATELGVTEITPIFSDRCEVRLKDERADKRLMHWRQVAISACEQCGRSRVPVIHPPCCWPTG